MRRLLLAVVLVPSAAWAGWPVGQSFEEAVVLDVTPEGFDALAEMVPAVVPPQVALPADSLGRNLYEYDEGECCVDIFIGELCDTCWSWELEVANGWLGTRLENLELTPKVGFVQLTAELVIQLNEAGDPLVVSGGAWAGSEFFDVGVDLGDTCNAWLDPIRVDISGSLHLEVVADGSGRFLDARIPEIFWATDLAGEDIHLEDCTIGEIVNFAQDVGGFVGFDPLGEIVGMLEPQIDAEIQGMIPDLELQIEEAFASARVEEVVDLAGAPLDVVVEPFDVEVRPEGARIQMAGSFDTAPHPCVADYLGGGSLETAGSLPAVGAAPAGVTSPHHLAAMVSDDFVNAGLYTAWSGGLLCYVLEEDEDLPVNTSLLGLVSSEAYADLFPETKPMHIVTDPRLPPVATVMSDHAIDVAIDGLGVDFVAELDHREARILGAEIGTDLGVDLAFDPPTGALEVDVAFDPGGAEIQLTHNDLAKEHGEAIAGSFSTLFDVLLDPLAGDLMSDVVFPLPSFEGYGVSGLELAAAGPQEDLIGVFGTLGPVAYENAGGCGGSSACAGGCSTGTAPAGLIALVPLLLALRRRRA